MQKQKSINAYRTIGEVSTIVDEPQYVLRFWEKNIAQIRPIKRKSGRRYYTVKIIKIILLVKHMLRYEGLTIKGVQKRLKSIQLDAAIEHIHIPDNSQKISIDHQSDAIYEHDISNKESEYDNSAIFDDNVLNAIRQLIDIHKELDDVYGKVTNKPMVAKTKIA